MLSLTVGQGWAHTITATRAATHGFFHTSRMAFLTTLDCAKLQGCNVREYDFSMLSHHQTGHLAGHAMHINVARGVVRAALKAANLM